MGIILNPGYDPRSTSEGTLEQIEALLIDRSSRLGFDVEAQEDDGILIRAILASQVHPSIRNTSIYRALLDSVCK